MSDVSLYDNIDGKFVVCDPLLREFVKEINEEIDACVAFDTYIYNFIFSNFTVIGSRNLKTNS